jgi:hypothetical protein
MPGIRALLASPGADRLICNHVARRGCGQSPGDNTNGSEEQLGAYRIARFCEAVRQGENEALWRTLV